MDETGQLQDGQTRPKQTASGDHAAPSDQTAPGQTMKNDQMPARSVPKLDRTEEPIRRSRLPRWAHALLWVGAIVVISIGVQLATTIPGTTVFGALILGAVIFRVGYFVLQQLATPIPPPPDPGTLRKVKITYRCSICSTEVRMTSAVNEDPEPPRHCMEDMEIVAPIME